MTQGNDHKDHTYTRAGAEALRGELRKAVADHTLTGIRVAHGLFDVYYGRTRDEQGTEIPVFLAWGFDTFEEYVESELGIHVGTARSYIRVWDELFIKRSFAEGVLPDSITKLRILSRLSSRCEPRELTRWVARSRELGCCDLEAAIEDELGEKSRRRTFSVDVKWSKLGPLLRALTQAKELLGVRTNGDALSKIVGEWSDAHKSERPSSTRKAG